MELLQAEPTLFAGLVFLLGLLIGSFLNVVIHRLPKMMEADWHHQCADLRGETGAVTPRYNLWVPRSACTQCGHQITALENIPLVSWLWLRGRCSACGTPISVRYPLVELLTALLSAAVAWKWGLSMQTLGALLLVWTLIALAFIDFDTTLLPDSLTLPLLWLGLLFNLNGHFASLHDAVIGAIAGYGVLWSVYWVFKWVTGKDGMGFGDFKLLAAIGAAVGSSFIDQFSGVALPQVPQGTEQQAPQNLGAILTGTGILALLVPFIGGAIGGAWGAKTGRNRPY